MSPARFSISVDIHPSVAATARQGGRGGTRLRGYPEDFKQAPSGAHPPQSHGILFDAM